MPAHDVAAVVVDSVTLNHHLRQPTIRNAYKKKPKKGSHKSRHTIHSTVSNGQIRIAIDKARSLVDEWIKTCEEEAVKQFIILCEGHQGLVEILQPRALGQQVNKKLRLLGFTDTVDKLVLRIAYGSEHKIVISDDSDFWDPSQPDNSSVKGNSNSPIAKICHDELGISVMMMNQLFASIH